MSRPDPERRVGDLVRRHAAQHDPDSVRIRSRMDLDEIAPAEPDARSVLRRIGAPVGSAVAAAVIAVVAVLGVRAAGGPDDGPLAASPGRSSTPTGPTATATTRPKPPSVGLPSLQPPMPPPSATGSPTPSASGTTPSIPPTGGPQLDVQSVLPGHPILLGDGNSLDWVLPGIRRDGTVVRREHPTTTLAGPDVRVGRGGATGVPGPYLSSWSGGAPEQDHLAATGWLAVDPDGGAVHLEAPAAAGRRLTLYVGTTGADCLIRAIVGNQIASVTVRAGTRAALVTISGGTGAGPLVVDLTGVSRSAGGRIGLAAVVLR